MKVLLDTGLLIRHLRNHKRAIQFLRILGKSDELTISVISRYELFVGTPATEMKVTKYLLSRMHSFPVTAQIADRAGMLSYQLRQQGTVIEATDILIGATALINNLPVATLNTNHFESIPGIRLYPIPGDI